MFEFDSHLLPVVPIDIALASLYCGTREGNTAGNLDSEHLLKVVVVGRKKPVAHRVVRTRARPTGYQNPRNIFALETSCCTWRQAERERGRYAHSKQRLWFSQPAALGDRRGERQLLFSISPFPLHAERLVNLQKPTSYLRAPFSRCLRYNTAACLRRAYLALSPQNRTRAPCRPRR